MEDPLVSLLARQSAKSLREMDESIGGQLEDLTTQRTWVRRALAAKGVELEPEAARAAPSATSNGNGKRPGRKRGSKRGAILQIMRNDHDPERIWLPSEVREALERMGIDVTVEAVRVTLRRMGEDQELVRPADGNGWKLAPGVSSPGEPSTTDLSEASTLV